jgi:hypothetical protein
MRRGLIFLVLGLACDSGEPAPAPCDPFAVVTKAITLGEVVAVGRERSGALDVIDRPASGQLRVFVSEGQTLKRQRTLGSGESNGGPGSWMVVTFGESSDPANLQVEFGAAGPVAMGLVRGSLPAKKMFDLATEGEKLELMGADAIRGFTLANLPGTVAVERSASLADGRLIVVTSPEVDTTYEDFRLFLGPPDRVVERKVINVSQSRSGVTFIEFTLDGARAEAVFGSSLSPDTPSTLNGEPLTLAPAGTRPPGASYLCRSGS